MTTQDSVSGRNDFVFGPRFGRLMMAWSVERYSSTELTIVITSTSILNPADGVFSVLAWVKGGAPGQVIVSQQSAANWLALDADGNLMTELKGAGRSTGPLFSVAVITDGQWHRAGLVWDGSNRILYVDEVAVSEDTQPNLEGSEMGIYIGTGKAMETGTYFSGLIDDVRISNRAVRP